MTHAETYRRILERQAFHALNATWGVLAYHAVVPRGLAILAVGTLTAMFGVAEVLRLRRPSTRDEILRHPVFGRIIRPHEVARVSGGFWFGVGVLATLILYPREIVEAACLTMGFGDAASTIVGVRFGSLRLPGGRSLQGSLAFVAASMLVVTAFRLVAYDDPVTVALSWAGVAAVAGAVAEALSRHIDDNVTVPVVAGAALWWVFA